MTALTLLLASRDPRYLTFLLKVLLICFLFRIDYDIVRVVRSIFQSTCARCSSYPWCCAALCIRWTCHMVPSGVHEKDMADTPKIVLAYSVIEETEARRDYIQDGTIFGRLLS